MNCRHGPGKKEMVDEIKSALPKGIKRSSELIEIVPTVQPLCSAN